MCRAVVPLLLIYRVGSIGARREDAHLFAHPSIGAVARVRKPWHACLSGAGRPQTRRRPSQATLPAFRKAISPGARKPHRRLGIDFNCLFFIDLIFTSIWHTD
jgi:hypothetical protein